MTLYTIVNMKLIRSRILPTSCVAQPSQRQSNSCDLLSYNHTTRMWNVTFCVFCLLSGYSSKTFRSSEMSHFHLYQIHISLFILIAACIICMSSFLLICWRFFPMFGVWLSVPRLFIVFSSVLTLKCTSCHLLWVYNILWIAANLTPLYLRLFLLSMFKHTNKECVACWHQVKSCFCYQNG